MLNSRRDRIDVVLVRPRNPLNIGAAARAMANFGFARLTVVAPYAPHWREARSAVGAPELLAEANEAATLSEAVSGCTLVAGTAALTHRQPEQRVVALPEFGPLAGEAIAQGGRVALVFGGEKHGLTSDDLAYCHLLVEIPTGPPQPSMNLGQAVAVCLYELAVSSRVPSAPGSSEQARPQPAPSSHSPGATSGVLDRLAGVIEESMIASGYSPAAMRAANRRDLRRLLRRMSIPEADAKRALRLFRRILWRMRHSAGAENSNRESH
jgi:TrmH family RNA methyltransferase